jgi:hypothetical protein
MAGLKKVPDEALAPICWMLSRQGGFTLRDVAALYGVSATQIYRIKCGLRKQQPTAAASPPGR